MLSENLLNKITVAVQCDPRQCRFSDCPLYFSEEKKCDAIRYINLFSYIMKDKFSSTDTYE